MRADSTSVRSMGQLDDTCADASATSPTAPSAGTSADVAQARWSTEGPTIVGVRSGTVLDPELVSDLRALAARTDIAQRVLTILEPGHGTEVASRSQLTRTLSDAAPAARDDASDHMECVRWYCALTATSRLGP